MPSIYYELRGCHAAQIRRYTQYSDNVPPGDVLIHNGDQSISTSFPDIQYQINWLKSLPHAHKIFIAGNDGLGLASGEKQKLNWNTLTYLQEHRLFWVAPGPKRMETGFLNMLQVVLVDVGDTARDRCPLTHMPTKFHHDLNAHRDESLYKELVENSTT